MHKKILVLGLLLVSLLTSVSFGLVFKYSRNDVALPDDGSIPRQVAYDSANNLICVLTENSARTTRSILRYLPDGTWASATTPSSQLTAKDMAVDSTGNVFNLGASGVNKFAIDGSLLTNIGSSTAVGEAQLVLPVALAIHGANLYVLDKGDEASPKVKRYSTSSGHFISSWTSPSLRAATAFTVGNNWAYFVTSSNRILKFPRLGATPVTEITGRGLPNSIATGYVESFGVFVPQYVEDFGSRCDLFRYSQNLTAPATLGIPATVIDSADLAIKSDATLIALSLPTTRQLSIYTGSR